VGLLGAYETGGNMSASSNKLELSPLSAKFFSSLKIFGVPLWQEDRDQQLQDAIHQELKSTLGPLNEENFDYFIKLFTLNQKVIANKISANEFNFEFKKTFGGDFADLNVNSQDRKILDSTSSFTNTTETILKKFFVECIQKNLEISMSPKTQKHADTIRTLDLVDSVKFQTLVSDLLTKVDRAWQTIDDSPLEKSKRLFNISSLIEDSHQLKVASHELRTGSPIEKFQAMNFLIDFFKHNLANDTYTDSNKQRIESLYSSLSETREQLRQISKQPAESAPTPSVAQHENKITLETTSNTPQFKK
jgi:hypothetical protein